MTQSMHALVDYFTGRWRMARRIRDRLAGEIGHLSGMATFAPVMNGLMAGGLGYDEAGEMILGAYRGAVSQRYLFVPIGGWAATVHHADGSPFHHLDLAGGWADVVHDCGADLYRGRYRLLGRDRWTLVWRVKGPRKDYLLATDYTRAAGDITAG